MRRRPIHFRFKGEVLTAARPANKLEPFEATVARSLSRRLGCEVTMWPKDGNDASITCEARYFKDDVFHAETVVISRL